MDALTIALVSILSVFTLLLILKPFLKKEFCVLCVAVSLTWMGLLFSFWLELIEDQVIIALLMGQTTVGIFYLIEKKVKEKLLLFRLPFLLTMILLTYFLLLPAKSSLAPFMVVVVTWIITLGMYLHQTNSKINKAIKKIVECCQRW